MYAIINEIVNSNGGVYYYIIYDSPDNRSFIYTAR